MPIHHRILFVVASLALACSCRTTKTQEATTSEAKRFEAKTSDGGPAALRFTNDDEQALYLQMMNVETNAGIKVAKDQLHTSRGLVECRRVGSLSPCTIRVRLTGLEISATQPLVKNVSPSLWAYAEELRPELKAEKLVLMSLLCDYIGKKSPPYNITSVRCEVSLPRMADEMIFLGKAAEELSEGIRGEAAYGPKLITLTGAVSCQWLKISPRTPCIVRAQAGGVLQEKITEMSPGVAAEVARSLNQAEADHARVTTPLANSSKSPPEANQNIVAALTCLVDNTKSETEGKRTYVCRAKI